MVQSLVNDIFGKPLLHSSSKEVFNCVQVASMVSGSPQVVVAVPVSASVVVAPGLALSLMRPCAC